MSYGARYLPWGVVALAVMYLGLAALPPRAAKGQARLYEFGKLPVVDHGRVKPVDTLARTSLMMLSGSQDFRDESEGKEHVQTRPALKWLLDLMTGGQRNNDSVRRAIAAKVFHVDPDLARLFKLPNSPDSLYSFEDLKDKIKAVWQIADDLAGDGQRTLNKAQQTVVSLAESTRLFMLLAGRQDRVFQITNDQVLALLDLEPRHGYRYAAGEFVTKLGPLYQQAKHARDLEATQRSLFEHKVLELWERVMLYVQLSRPDRLFAVPPEAAGQEWKRLEEASDKDAVAKDWEEFLDAYKKNVPADFNRAVADCRDNVRSSAAGALAHSDFEVFYNHFAPFYQCAILYVLVIVLAALGWFRHLGFLQRAAFLLAGLTFAVHFSALLARMYLSGRWLVFVTNLYSSFVFVGLMAVVLGLILQLIYRNGIGNMLAGVMGFASLVVAYNFGSDGDTLEMLQAVLDTNFWLATHVTCITIGYAATLVAGCLGLGYVLVGVLTPWLDKDLQKAFGQTIYGILCFATLFSFTGTVLGGIWADQSWGRFWGWDPKENGALLIVLWNAMILHARWCGLVKQRGIAVLAIGGNMVTGWSWLGTNQLGVGLHAYGFNNTLALALTIFWIFHLSVIGIGLLPKWMWQSFRAQLAPSSTSQNQGSTLR